MLKMSHLWPWRALQSISWLLLTWPSGFDSFLALWHEEVSQPHLPLLLLDTRTAPFLHEALVYFQFLVASAISRPWSGRSLLLGWSLFLGCLSGQRYTYIHVYTSICVHTHICSTIYIDMYLKVKYSISSYWHSQFSFSAVGISLGLSVLHQYLLGSTSGILLLRDRENERIRISHSYQFALSHVTCTTDSEWWHQFYHHQFGLWKQ